MGITVVEHNDINVKIAKPYLYGNTKKKESVAKHRDKRKIMDCYAEGMGLNSICRVFKVGINSLQAWIKEEGKKFIQPDITEEKFVPSRGIPYHVMRCGHSYKRRRKRRGYGYVTRK
jgi:hypothetical protein